MIEFVSPFVGNVFLSVILDWGAGDSVRVPLWAFSVISVRVPGWGQVFRLASRLSLLLSTDSSSVNGAATCI